MSQTSVPPRSPPLDQRNGCLTAMMIGIGTLLLLPGICVVITVFLAVPGFLIEVPRRLIRGEALEAGFGLILAGWAVFWLVCLLISYLGIRLIRRARS
jgi:hypothetical protein